MGAQCQTMPNRRDQTLKIIRDLQAVCQTSACEATHRQWIKTRRLRGLWVPVVLRTNRHIEATFTPDSAYA